MVTFQGSRTDSSPATPDSHAADHTTLDQADRDIYQAVLDETAARVSAVAGCQPLDSDLTAIAALTTTTFGRALLTQADAAATRSTLGLGTAATSASSAFDAAGAAAAAQAASQPLDSDLTAIAALTTTSYGRAFLALADAAAALSAIGALSTAGGTLTGPLTITQSATGLLLAIADTDDATQTTGRIQLLNSGVIKSIGSDAAFPSYTALGSTDPQLLIVHTKPGSSGNGTGLRIRGSASSTITQPFAIEDATGIPILWTLTAGGMRMTDALLLLNDVFYPTQQAGFAFRNSNGSGAILAATDALSLILGVSTRTWTGDPVPSGKLLGMSLTPRLNSIRLTNNATASGTVTLTLTSTHTLTGTTVQGSNIVTVTSWGTALHGNPNHPTLASEFPTGITGTGIPASTTAYLSDTLDLRAWDGLAVHGAATYNDLATPTANGRLIYSGGLVLSGDDDTDGWLIATGDKTFRPTTDSSTSLTGFDIGSSTKRVKTVFARSVVATDELRPPTGSSTTDLGSSAAAFRTAYVNDIQGAVNDGWTNSVLAWTRVDDTHFTVAVDATTTFTKGTRLKWTDSGGVKYGVVGGSAYASSVTTVTLISTTDYVMASSPSAGAGYYSYQVNPRGYPTWFGFTPTHTGFSANPTFYCRWSAWGNTLKYHYRCSADGTSNATNYLLTIPIPVTLLSTYFTAVANSFAVDNSAALTGASRAYIATTNTTITLASNMSTGTWTASGGKRAVFTLEYEF